MMLRSAHPCSPIEVESYNNRLEKIVDDGLMILHKRLESGMTTINNEASLQLHLASIFKILGELAEYSANDHFSIELEAPVSLVGQSFLKSNSNKANIDIFLKFENTEKNEKPAFCAIELKFFKKINQREPNNRYDVFVDLKNLETYVSNRISDLGFLIVGTDHRHYVDQKTYSNDTGDFDFRHGAEYTACKKLDYKTNNYGPPIILGNNYKFLWELGAHCFLKVKV
ncbi:MAG: hypothetical protein HYV97_03820 [Bdellovibrio sp.]|nr:hypothetical protein [Bdellovibrio sp.]